MLSKTAIWNHNVVIPPLLFDCVSPGVYRSNLFGRENFSFIKSLGLKCIVYIGETGVGEEVDSFIQRNQIHMVYLFDNCPSVEDDWKPISDDTVKKALEIIVDPANFPVLILCKDGVRKTGVVVGCLRRLQNWCITSIIQEYHRVAFNSRTDTAAELYIELFSPELISFCVFSNNKI